MHTVGAFEAKTHFSELLVKVANGESVMITKHGEKIAMLVPVAAEEIKKTKVQAAIEGIRRLRKGVTLGKDLTIKQLREEGRR